MPVFHLDIRLLDMHFTKRDLISDFVLRMKLQRGFSDYFIYDCIFIFS